VLFVTLAHWAGYELLFSERDRKWWWIFYVSLAFAFLAKGPIGWTPVLAVASTLLFLRATESAGRSKFIPGLALMLAIVALWGIAALLRTHGEFFRIGIGRHVFARSFGAMEGHGANSFGAYLLLLPFYFVTIFASFFPWSIKLPWLMRKLWRDRDKIDNYLLTGAAIIFLLFTLIKTKLPHYTLPAFPLLALLLARRLADNETSISFLKKWATTIAAIYIFLALLIAPLLASWFPARELFRQSREYLRPEMQFAAVDFNEPSLVWYFRSAVRGWLSTVPPRNVQPFMEQTGARFVILPTELAQKLYPTLPVDWKSFSTSGFNIPKGKRVHLTLILKPS
jgi:4-amino-4-deoxy-L-arabinose transferase-like glycosyltransferase